MGRRTPAARRRLFPKSALSYATGSAQCMLIPYWSKRLGKKKLISFQASKRTGIIYGELHDERVFIGGYARDYLKGEIEIK